MYDGTPIELLAPAKNLAVGRAAIDAGADAVYIGGPAFGARKSVGNTVSDIAELVRYAAFWNVRVLVAINTLLKENEYAEAVKIARECKNVGVYAFIVQDMRLASMLLSEGGFRLHASTQCDNRTVERVRELENAGFKRVVLARELSYNQMTEISSQVSCELEAFVHGALCVSFSGRCFLSEEVCGRSANRGECAQMCRLPYDILDCNKNIIAEKRHILSLYDLDRSVSLQALLSTGVGSLKIEGRLKDADYVTNITAYYNKLLSDMGVKRTSQGRVVLGFQPDPAKTFHRGSTEYFSFSRLNNLVNQHTPKSTGELIGYAPIPEGLLSDKQLHNGDGLTFNGEGFYWQQEKKYHIPTGTAVYRNYDIIFQKQLQAPVATVRLLPVTICFVETDTGFSLSIKDSLDSISIVLEIPSAEKQIADNAAMAEINVRGRLARLGGTPLVAEEVMVVWKRPYFLRDSVLNEWRRKAVDLFLMKKSDNGRQQAMKHMTNILPCQQVHAQTICQQRQYQDVPSDNALMTCKYCILYETGYCKKNTNKDPSVRLQREPVFIRTGNTVLRIVTDCAECEMKLVLTE